GDRLSGAYILGGECGGTAAPEGNAVGAKSRHGGSTTQRIGEGRVVHLVGGRHAADEEVGRGDVGRKSGGLNQGVVAGVGAGERVAADGDRLSGAYILGGECGGATASQGNT